jgi:hypothetical protein
MAHKIDSDRVLRKACSGRSRQNNHGKPKKRKQQKAKSAAAGQPEAPYRSIIMTAAEKKTTAMCG